MFYFFCTTQTAENASWHKGDLFEKLLRRYLSDSGYDVELARRKQNSLEYDITGVHRVDHRSVVGEAKAHEDTVGFPAFGAFVAKALPHLCKGSFTALFLATSALSPEAEDYAQNLGKTTPYEVTRICGAKLEQQVRSAIKLPSEDAVANAVRSLIPNQTRQHLLQTDRGVFILVLGSDAGGVFDDRFALVDASGHAVTDEAFLGFAKTHIQALQELEPVYAPTLKSIPRRTITRGLITAGGWLDYRWPAGPDFFVGRRDALDRATSLIEHSTSGLVMEVKSRSGVGKSSLLAVLKEQWEAAGHTVELHDARDVQSADDVLFLIQRFASCSPRIRSLEDVSTALSSLDGRLGSTNRAIFMVDQIESTFQIPEVFLAYEYLALSVVRGAGRISMVYARKDDLLTTHDELLVSLDRLRALSSSISLSDFDVPEAAELIRQISASAPARLSSKISEQVLEFARGFPWLLKRTMAHVVALRTSGISAQDLLSSGLHLEDLFDEELAELDEQERGYLTRIAAFLPATYVALARRFEDDPFLRGILEKLTARRLLRFSAGTYDTYNDVFKEFLIYERLPERSESQLFKLGLVPVLAAFRALGGGSIVDPKSYGAALKRGMSATYNLLRELRLAGLIARSTSSWFVPDVVRGYEHQGRLGEYVRQSVLKNRLVTELQLILERGDPFSRTQVASFLRQRFPFVQAQDHVWGQYAATFLDWMQRLELIHINESGDLLAVRKDKQAILRDLGNLTLVGRGSRGENQLFMPSREWSVFTRLCSRANRGPIPRATLGRAEGSAAEELRKLGALELDSAGEYRALMTCAQLEADVRDILNNEPYVSFWGLMISGTPWETAVERCLGFENLAVETRKAMGKKLGNWGRQFGHLPKGRMRRASPSAQQHLPAVEPVGS